MAMIWLECRSGSLAESMVTLGEPEATAKGQIASHRAEPPDTLALAEQRHRRLIVFTGCFLVFALVALLMPMPFKSRVWNHLADLLHIPAFGIINYLALTIAAYHFPSRWRVPLLVTSAVLAFSAGIELLQGLVGRYASLSDLFCNAMGASAALLIRQSRYEAVSKRYCWSLRSVSALLIALAVLSPLSALFDIYLQHRQFPIIASFNSRAELQRWYVGSAIVHIRPLPWFDGQSTARVTFLPGDFPAIRLVKLHHDWTEQQAFVTELSHRAESQSERVMLRLQISNQQDYPDLASSFAKIYEIERGDTQKIRIAIDDIRKGPADGDLALDGIASVEFLAIDLDKPATVEIQPLRLEKATTLAFGRTSVQVTVD
jgi:glycopeptide antibiotics resistance protein